MTSGMINQPAQKNDVFLYAWSDWSDYTIAWITRPERSKGAKYEVKQARRAQSQAPEGP